MSGNEDVFRFQEGSVLCLATTSDTGANLEVIDNTTVPLLLLRSSSFLV
jgi:hypothetical protein